MSADATNSEEAISDERLPTHVRLVRVGYVLIAGLFIVGVLIQVYIAGMAVFVNPARWSMHATFVHIIEWMPLIMLVLAFPGRLSRELKLLSIGLFVLVIVQYATALGFSDSLVAAIHPVNALIIFGLAVVTTRWAWHEVTDRQGTQRPTSEAA